MSERFGPIVDYTNMENHMGLNVTDLLTYPNYCPIWTNKKTSAAVTVDKSTKALHRASLHTKIWNNKKQWPGYIKVQIKSS